MNKSFKELADFVNNFDTRNQSQRKEDSDKQQAISNGAHYLGDMEAKNGLTYEIWIPTSHKSANILRNIYKGGNDIGTAWCITVADNDNYWNNYIEEGNNFIFLIIKNPILSQASYNVDDKVAVQIEPNDDITLWDMNDDAETLYKNNFKSIIDFAIKKSEEDKLFPNKYEYITIDGKTIKTIRPNINCANKNLTTLEGSPEKVDGSFECDNNKLTTLENGPKEVGKGFYCSGNELTSLKGAPQKVGGDFYCSNNQLTSLEGVPKKIGGEFYCDRNKLISLEGTPQEINGYFNCSNNQLTSLKGAPRKIGKYFNCSNNPDLPKYKIDAYKAFLKLSDSEKAPLTKDNHYYPTEEWENKFR